MASPLPLEPVVGMYGISAVPATGFPSSETILGGFASLRPGAKRERMVPYPIRFPASQIAELDRLRDEQGIIPAEFIREAVAVCLALLRKP